MKSKLIYVLFLAAACQPQSEPAFSEGMILGGEQVSAETLNAGKRAYSYYCVACHGVKGDGRGPAAEGLQTPPRDFRLGVYKFAGVVQGLPHDEDLIRIARAGLAGTAMLEWNLSEEMMRNIIQYTKTFAPEGQAWRHPDLKRGQQVKPGEDPWGGTTKAAIERGKAIYHGKGTCYTCHPSYVTLKNVSAFHVDFGKPPVTSLRPKVWLPEPKASESYSTAVPGDPSCEKHADCKDPKRMCVFGRCEQKQRIMPPDFLLNQVRAGETARDLFRVIAAGVPGTAMPTWQGSIPPKDIWAIAHYVHHLIGLKGTVEAEKLRASIKSDTPPALLSR